MAEAVSLFSGSLSSSISTELVVRMASLDRVVVLTLRSPFFDEFDRVKGLARKLWPRIRFRSKSIKKEIHRIGAFGRKGRNGQSPYCSKCQSVLLETGGNFLDRIGADFLVTGEEVKGREGDRAGELVEIDREAGLDGLVFRPLSIPNLPETLPERKGWVPRDELHDGWAGELREDLRSRLRGEDYDFLSAGARCKLTRKRYRKRLKDLMREEGFNVNDLSLLDFEHYFKIPPGTKVVLGKGAEGKRRLHNYFLPRDLRFYLPSREGPMALVRPRRKEGDDEERREEVVGLAARIVAGVSGVEAGREVEVNYRFEHENATYTVKVYPLDGESLRELRL